MLKVKKTALFLTILTVFLAIYTVSGSKVEYFRKTLDPLQTVSALLVEPEVLKIASGEFRFLFADYLLLKASAFLGGRHQDRYEDMQVVATLFRQSLHLDPYFMQTAYYIQSFLTWRGEQVNTAIDLLKIHQKYRNWDWEPPYHIGFNYFYFLHDFKNAARYLKESAKMENAGPLVTMLASRMMHKSDQTETSILFLQNMLAGANDENTKKIIKLRLNAHVGVLILERAITAYRQKFGQNPESLEKLLEEKIIGKMPENPLHGKFYYEPDTGKVFFDQIR